MRRKISNIFGLIAFVITIHSLAQKTVPSTSTINLIGKTRPVVDKQLGKPTREDKQVGGGALGLNQN